MADIKIKICSRCLSSFECHSADVTNCQCATVKLLQSERDDISRLYSDCLCKKCLMQLQAEKLSNEFQD